jgi:hypothetical protein
MMHYYIVTKQRLYEASGVVTALLIRSFNRNASQEGLHRDYRVCDACVNLEILQHQLHSSDHGDSHAVLTVTLPA